MSIGETNALFVATLPYPPGVRQCRIAAEAAASELDTAGDATRLPPQRLGSRLRFDSGQLSSYISVIDAADQDHAGINEEQTDGYTRRDLGASYKIPLQGSGELTSFVKVKNISDEEIRNLASFLREVAPEAGRSIEVGFRVNF